MRRRGLSRVARRRGAAWPLAARAQQDEPDRRVGVLMGSASEHIGSTGALAAFVQALTAISGWTEGRNLRIEYLWAAATPDTSNYAAELPRSRRHWPRSRRTSSWPLAPDHGAVAAGDPHRADRVRDCPRSGRRRLCRQPGAAGRQCHRVHGCSNTA